MATRKKKKMTIKTFVGEVMSPLFNTLSRVVITFFPRSKSLIFMALVTVHGDFEVQENNMPLLPLVSSFICHEVIGQDAIILFY